MTFDSRESEGEFMKLNADVGEGFGVWSMGNDHALMPHIDMAISICGINA